MGDRRGEVMGDVGMGHEGMGLCLGRQKAALILSKKGSIILGDRRGLGIAIKGTTGTRADGK